MRFDRLDLNLLVALDALLMEKNVSVAAERVNLSQSAMSGALHRLREYFEDDLLVNSGRHMILTARAESLVEPVRNIMMQMRSTIISKPIFEPQNSHREIIVQVSDYMILVAVADTLRAIAAEAPNMRFCLRTTELSDPWEELDRGEVDLMVIIEQYITSKHPHALLFEEEYVVVGWDRNSHFDSHIDLKTYAELGHVTVSHGMRRFPTFEELYVRMNGIQRRVEVLVPAFSDVPYLLVGTQRIATMHRRLAEMTSKVLPLKIAPVPFNIPKVRMMVQWHSMNDKDQVLAWIVSHLKESCAKNAGS